MSTTAVATSIVYNIPEVNSGTTTSWIPVTTPWPSSSGCASAFFLYPGQPAPVAWDPGYGYFFGGSPRCLPPAATTWWEQDHQNGDGFTSLSIRPIVCPAAFTTAATSVQSGSSTQVLCCPSGYDLLNGEPGRAVGICTSPLTHGQTITYLASLEAGIGSTTLAVNSSTWIQAIPFEGWNVATPTTEPPSGSTSSSLSSSTSGSPSSLTSSPPSSSTTTQQSCDTLSSGAKAGIGASAAIGGIGIIALIGALFLLRRRPKVTQHRAFPPVPAEPKHLFEMGDQQHPVELPSAR